MPTITRRHDPDRRARILRATLDVVAEHGVAGTTHRRIAAVADVPLGSMTYHFASLDDLLTEAFTLLADTVAARFTERLAAAGTRAEACEAVVDLVVDDSWATPRNLLLSYELYAYAARVPALRGVMQGWMGKSRAALEQHFAPGTARALDAMIEGLSIHRSVDLEPAGRAEVRAIVARLTGDALALP
ncbi:TetR/AcrR family transcriptional regulator [Methylobacterium frigidaeris]|uniref:HTH-type transcriptional regulator RcdA n=1 Tax=Methylobacterium frigidaeris TaxID=2038277 RepID=A0AA37M4W3_9HYPH|nr:TetR family transcriptional regulator [Methylobacterium frigidaeris]PIK69760.1 TetR family transcriptional regulator [Methylobacterium frigidaeris]GJD62917.1 HTH-type transcriptional regulator RcdA [Methylobacterium frigidaeris]